MADTATSAAVDAPARAGAEVGIARDDWCPRLVTGVERRAARDSVLIARPDGRVHFRLDNAEADLLDHLDGTTTVGALATAHGPSVRDLVADLGEGGFIDGVPGVALPRVAVGPAGVEIDGLDAVMRSVSRLLDALTRGHLGALLAPAAVAAVAGLCALAAAVAWWPDVPAGRDAVGTVWLLVMTSLPLSMIHESAHALVTVRAGRRIGACGFGFYWGGVAFFVDATDALFLRRRDRMRQAAAGPVADLLVAGIVSLIAWRIGPDGWGLALRTMALVVVFDTVVNLTPLLELDGYWLLADALDTPNLRADSLTAMRRFGRGGRRQRALAAYGLAAGLFGLVLLVSGIALWIGELLPVAHEAFTASWAGKIGAALFVAPLAIAVLSQAARTLLTWIGSTGSRRRRGEEVM